MDLCGRFPRLADALPKLSLASVPTPVRRIDLEVAGRARRLWVKSDDATALPYGGNKVRKLEYLFGRIARGKRGRPLRAVATFGTVGSNHALATAIYARRLGYDALCFLAHQTRSAHAGHALRAHLSIGSELVPWVGDYRSRLAIQREHLWHRRTAVIPMGGSSWTGSLGFVDAGLELAAQIGSGALPAPHRIYLATGTMGSAAGLAVGLALARIDAEIHAVRVSPPSICSDDGLKRLMRKICAMLNRIEPAIDPAVLKHTNVILRQEFFGPGYAKSTPATDDAIAIAGDQAGLLLETTYTGKAMAAVIADSEFCARRRTRQLFWNTYSSAPLPNDDDANVGSLPDAFRRYVDSAAE